DHQRQRGGHEDDQQRDLPAWPSRARDGAGPRAGVVTGVWVRGLVSHVGVLFCRAAYRSFIGATVLGRHYVAVKSLCIYIGGVYAVGVPKLWNGTIEAHRRAVRDATLDATAALVASHGLASVTMSQIAEQAGIGRATLYKYFPDVEAILTAWHERQVAGHLEHLSEIRDHGGDARERLEAVLGAYALMTYERPHGT